MKICDLCGDSEIWVEDGDVHLCKSCAKDQGIKTDENGNPIL